MRYAVLLAALLLVGCGPSKEARKEYVQKHNRPPAIESSIVKGNIRVDMSKKDVRASWGKPHHVNNSYYEGVGRKSQWCYDRGQNMQCVYFENGYVTGWN